MLRDVRFGYGAVVPLDGRVPGRRLFGAGPDALMCVAPSAGAGRGRFEVHFAVRRGSLSFSSTGIPRTQPPPRSMDAALPDDGVLARVVRPCPYQGRWREAVLRSLSR